MRKVISTKAYGRTVSVCSVLYGKCRGAALICTDLCVYKKSQLETIYILHSAARLPTPFHVAQKTSTLAMPHSQSLWPARGQAKASEMA